MSIIDELDLLEENIISSVRRIKKITTVDYSPNYFKHKIKNLKEELDDLIKHKDDKVKRLAKTISREREDDTEGILKAIHAWATEHSH